MSSEAHATITIIVHVLYWCGIDYYTYIAEVCGGWGIGTLKSASAPYNGICLQRGVQFFAGEW